MEITTASNMKAGDKALFFVQRHWPKLQITVGVIVLVLVVSGMGR